ncbi:MAG: large subunit ribosomal protein L25 [Candidatus Tokpelaia sp. JSC189]|nr:MAG: large subunit ribosomal protein L25 [Candidatus Tokpelaia sp. JSC189]
MSKSYTLKAEARERVGKGSTRELRRNGQIPAVIYGEKQPPLPIALSYKDVYYRIHSGGFRTMVATIQLGSKKVQVLPKDYQLDPVCDTPVHVDFLRISSKSIVQISIPVHFLNEEECPGIQKNGVLNIIHHSIEAFAPATAIPESIEVDLTGYQIGEAIHLSSIKLPEDVEVIAHEGDFTIATIATPVAKEKSESAAADEMSKSDLDK